MSSLIKSSMQEASQTCDHSMNPERGLAGWWKEKDGQRKTDWKKKKKKLWYVPRRNFGGEVESDPRSRAFRCEKSDDTVKK
jgi:uncharacterized protein YcaQ